MPSLTVASWGALATIAGGLLFTLEGVVDALSPAASPLAVVLSPAVLLLLVGFLGFHALQGERYGTFGTAVVVVIVAGLLVDAAGKAGMLREPVTVIGVLAVMLGCVLYGVVTWRAGVLPRWCGVAFIITPPLPIFIDPYGAIPFGLLWLALGCALWARSDAFSRRPAPVR